jgi:hypothetical protein
VMTVEDASPEGQSAYQLPPRCAGPLPSAACPIATNVMPLAVGRLNVPVPLAVLSATVKNSLAPAATAEDVVRVRVGLVAPPLSPVPVPTLATSSDIAIYCCQTRTQSTHTFRSGLVDVGMFSSSQLVFQL